MDSLCYVSGVVGSDGSELVREMPYEDALDPYGCGDPEYGRVRMYHT